MNNTLIRPLILGALLATALSAQADGSIPHPALRFMMTAGVTAGGDKISEIKFTNGNSSNITAGGRAQFGAGLVWRPENSPFSMQLTANYQFSGVFADNGSANFSRFPIELMGYYHFNDAWRIGAGARYVMSPSYSFKVDGGSNTDVDFKDTLGGVVEVGYSFNPNTVLSLRYVKEEYELKDAGFGSPKIDGSHVGLMGSYIF